jgi:D-alanyl-D-alanine dipeptidase
MRRWRNMLPSPLFVPAFLLVVTFVLACGEGTLGTPAPDLRTTTLALARRHGLIEVTAINPRIRSRLRYATASNAAGRVLYPPDMPCLLREATARKLSHAQVFLEEHGLGILIWDAYRPPEIQQALWELSGRAENFVSDPALGWSAHCTGTAIDLTLVDHTGRALPMPTDFDVLSKHASALYTGDDPEIRRRLRLLQKAMRSAGLSPYIREWWHFSDPDFQPLGAEHVVFAGNLGIHMNPPRRTRSATPSLPAR